MLAVVKYYKNLRISMEKTHGWPTFSQPHLSHVFIGDFAASIKGAVGACRSVGHLMISMKTRDFTNHNGRIGYYWDIIGIYYIEIYWDVWGYIGIYGDRYIYIYILNIGIYTIGISLGYIYIYILGYMGIYSDIWIYIYILNIRRPRPSPRQGRRLGPPEVWNLLCHGHGLHIVQGFHPGLWPFGLDIVQGFHPGLWP